MYHIKTIITPINYATAFSKAVGEVNTLHRTNLIRIDCYILNSLIIANAGMRLKPLMLTSTGRINIQRFEHALARLLLLQYIVRTEYKNAKYYSITMQGIAAVNDLNSHTCKIIELVHGPGSIKEVPTKQKGQRKH